MSADHVCDPSPSMPELCRTATPATHRGCRCVPGKCAIHPHLPTCALRLEPREHPPAQVVEAPKGSAPNLVEHGCGIVGPHEPDIWCVQVPMEKRRPIQPLGGVPIPAEVACETCPPAPTDPARKPSDEDEAAMWAKLLAWRSAIVCNLTNGDLHKLLTLTKDCGRTAREQGRQAGAEEMREACAEWHDSVAASAAADDRAGYARDHRHYAAAIRALPIPEPRS